MATEGKIKYIILNSKIYWISFLVKQWYPHQLKGTISLSHLRKL